MSSSTTVPSAGAEGAGAYSALACKNKRERAIPTARTEQPVVADGMSIVIWNVLTQQIDESILRVPCFHSSLQLTILGPKHHPVLVDLDESMLGDRGPLT